MRLQWRDIDAHRPEAVRGGWIAGAGDFLGFAAVGRIVGERSPLDVRGPLREYLADALLEYLADALLDRDDPERCEWIVVGVIGP